MKFPDFFRIRTAQEKRTQFRLDHSHKTTTDFFRMQPLLAREMVPQDKFDATVSSLTRFFTMPFPTYGNIKFANRAFFVPFRQVMEGFNEFIENTTYVNSSGGHRISHVPVVGNDTLASFLLSCSDPIYKLTKVSLQVVLGGTLQTVYVFCDSLGSVVTFYGAGGIEYFLLYLPITNQISFCNFTSSDGAAIDSALLNYFEGYYNQTVFGDFGSSTGFVNGTWLSPAEPYFGVESGDRIDFTPVSSGSNIGYLYIENSVLFNALDYEDYSVIQCDFVFDSVMYRFNNVGRKFYSLLCSLGYRVDFTYGNQIFTNMTQYSALPLLCYLKVALDYYENPAYPSPTYNSVFFGTNKVLSSSDLSNISKYLVCNYDRDYFTSAWNHPAGPNQYNSADIPIIRDQNLSGSYRNEVSGDIATGHEQGTPLIQSLDAHSTGSHVINPVSQYMIEALKSVSDFMHRHQMAGYKAYDRFFAEFGIKLSDDRSNRCYWLGSQVYNTTVKDIMSTAQTSEGALGEYAGKALSYSDQHHFTYETSEYGMFIIIQTCVPEVGYVQGVKRELFHINYLEFHRGQFDNLGTQAIRKDELFADYGMSSFDGKGVVNKPVGHNADGCFGWCPRYAEYKVGQDYLTGDFIIPSRRTGMDAFHLDRLFSGRTFPVLDSTFSRGESAQYDRIFNNTDENYDHMYQIHEISINALRPMKSLTEVICFDDDHGTELDIPGNGTMLN